MFSKENAEFAFCSRFHTTLMDNILVNISCWPLFLWLGRHRRNQLFTPGKVKLMGADLASPFLVLHSLFIFSFEDKLLTRCFPI